MPDQKVENANARNAVIAGFLGWTFDAFDFFVLVFAVSAISKDFDRPIPAVVLTITATLATRPLGALLFGLLADRFGRRIALMSNILFYTLMEVLSGLAPNYGSFLVLRLLYGIGMGGNWGVGASLAMESVPLKWRGFASGLLQEGYSVGNLLAAATYFAVFPRWGWRPMFFIGTVPALLTLLICLKVKDPQAWHESRTDWANYRRAIFGNAKLFVYLAFLMAAMNFVSHGTQDLYPTFLQKQRLYNSNDTAVISAISMFGAIIGSLLGGSISERVGRRKCIATALLLGLLTIPAWLAASKPVLILGAFLMQMMVQAGWGVIPAHINELSPSQLRGFFPGFAYQIGVLIASSIGYIEAIIGEHFSYVESMGGLAAAVLVVGAVIIWAGPEAKGVGFTKRQTAGSAAAGS
jgi:SHS family lactate transporter-like MFS transporter